MSLNPFKKKDNSKKEGISGTKIHVVINRLMSDITPVVVAEFEAQQQKDDSFNFQIVNHDLKFKEDLSIVKERVLDYIIYRLELKNKTKADAIKLVETKIDAIDKELKGIKDGKIEKEVEEYNEKTNKTTKVKKWIKINRIDKENELNHYKVLKFNIETKGDGSYERMNGNGDREIQFATIEGVLYPYFWRSNKEKDSRLLIYPDMVSKRKFYKEASERVLDDYVRSQNGFFSGIKGILVTIAIVLLFITGTILTIRGSQKIQDAELMIQERTKQCYAMCEDKAIECSYYYTKLIQDEIMNRSINISTPTINTDKKETSAMVDISQNLVG